jgi:hypothetical protein
MTAESAIDVHALIRDLRIAARYASRAGLLKDTMSLDLVKSAENTTRKNERPDVPILVKALNEVARVISPITIADLQHGRDPFAPENQKKAKIFQLLLSALAILMIAMIGYSTLAMQSEEAALSAVAKLQDLHADLKLNSLRRLAQGYKISSGENVNSIKYHEDLETGLDELRRVNAQTYQTITEAVDNYNRGLFPIHELLAYFSNDQTGQVARGESAPTTIASPSSAPTSKGASTARVIMSKHSTDSDGKNVSNIQPDNTQPVIQPVIQPDAYSLDSEDFCAADAEGNIRVPPSYKTAPPWLQQMFSEQLNDDCFLFEVVSPDGSAVPPSQVLNEVGFATGIKTHVAIRARWLLPFCYGLFGAIIFLMRNVASIRTPAMAWSPMIMRILLGGVAGIIIGWFSSTQNVDVESTGALSIPYASAFLVGYGIEVLFNLLDGLNRALGEVKKSKA